MLAVNATSAFVTPARFAAYESIMISTRPAGAPQSLNGRTLPGALEGRDHFLAHTLQDLVGWTAQAKCNRILDRRAQHELVDGDAGIDEVGHALTHGLEDPS